MQRLRQWEHDFQRWRQKAGHSTSLFVQSIEWQCECLHARSVNEWLLHKGNEHRDTLHRSWLWDDDADEFLSSNDFSIFFNFQTWKWEEIWLVRSWNIIDSRAFFPFHRSTRFWRNARDDQSPTDRTGSSRIFIRCGQRRREKMRRSTTLTSRSITTATPQLNIRRQLATHSIAISCCNTIDCATIKAISTRSPAHRLSLEISSWVRKTKERRSRHQPWPSHCHRN